MDKNLQPSITLNNGVKIPQLGMGVWKTPIKETATMVQNALANGYVLIDTAKQYGNEEGVGQGMQAAIKSGKVTRDDIFLTTKIFNGDQGDYDRVRKGVEGQLKALQTDHVDLLLEHWPVNGRYVETWKAMEAILADGQARAIGVCNFDNGRMINLIDHAKTLPTVNQIEFNPGILQPHIVKFDKAAGIQLEAWSPLGHGSLLNEPVINEIAQAHHKTAAQVILRWGLQHGVIELCKTAHVARMKENADIFDFTLTPFDMMRIDALDKGQHAIWYDKFKWSGNPDGVDDYIGAPGRW
ncbi:aldo/keto reductase [Limosilactobacillus secaliphilus]|uniref:Aldo keto reductase family oxidoreductase n=1 Tax=Limosilactobacillus secaliphilus TaxID=396268 RepID=A0A0R2I394_9LACO|nr:aldo/keto reductase [Limosilactobacillus secaliphilus]KRN59278.1 aldo keto reductase family oxidoreductase [Limosilactobacillus secaliphilus]